VVTGKESSPLDNKQDLQEDDDSHPIIKTILKNVIDLMELKKGKSLRISQMKRRTMWVGLKRLHYKFVSEHPWSVHYLMIICFS
jgi:hypothetical protein